MYPGVYRADTWTDTQDRYKADTKPILRKSFADKAFVLVDIVPKFIKHIEETCAKDGIKNVKGIVCNPSSTELPENSVDLVFICDTYHHFEFPFRTMASIHRALRPGGKVVVVDFHRIEGKSREWILNHVRAGQETVVREIASCGFKKIGEERFLDENYLVLFEKMNEKK